MFCPLLGKCIIHEGSLIIGFFLKTQNNTKFQVGCLQSPLDEPVSRLLFVSLLLPPACDASCALRIHPGFSAGCDYMNNLTRTKQTFPPHLSLPPHSQPFACSGFIQKVFISFPMWDLDVGWRLVKEHRWKPAGRIQVRKACVDEKQNVISLLCGFWEPLVGKRSRSRRTSGSPFSFLLLLPLLCLLHLLPSFWLPCPKNAEGLTEPAIATLPFPLLRNSKTDSRLFLNDTKQGQS